MLVSLRVVLASLALTLPFPDDFLDRIQVYESPTQEIAQPGWLGYACFQQSMTYVLVACPNTSAPTIVLLPLIDKSAGADSLAWRRNVVAHETMHLWTGRTGPPDDPFLERQAYRLGCNVSWIAPCSGWTRR